MTVGDQAYSWSGVIVRSSGEVEAGGRMVGVVVRVDSPYSAETNNGRPQLRINDYVEVQFDGTMLHKILSLPRETLREHSRVWVVENDKLLFRKVEVIRTEDNEILITAGLKAGEQVILTSLTAVTENMKVRIKQKSRE